MNRRPHSIAGWIGYGVLGLFVVAAIVLVAGTVYQYLANREDLRSNPPPGQLVDVGGHRLHLWCTGAGSPVVVLEVGGGGNVLEWTLVQPEVAKTTRACSYDRAGFGWSELGPNPRSAAQIVSELHTLLRAAQVPGPYILAGHSLGGLFVRLYASAYPAEVAGMVLVDSTHEDFQQRMPPEASASGGSPRALHLIMNLNKVMAVVGFARLTGAPLPRGLGVDEETIKLAEQIRFRTRVPFADAAETLALDESMRQVRETQRVLDIPLAVVTRGRYDGLRRLPKEAQERIKEAWESMQTDLVSLSPQGTQVVAAKSEHYVHLQQPAVVVDAIRRIVAQARLSTTTSAGVSHSSVEADSSAAPPPK